MGPSVPGSARALWQGTDSGCICGGTKHNRPSSSASVQSTKGPGMSLSCAKSNHLEVPASGVVGGKVRIPSRQHVLRECFGPSSHPCCQEITGWVTSKDPVGAPDPSRRAVRARTETAHCERGAGYSAALDRDQQQQVPVEVSVSAVHRWRDLRIYI